MKNKKSLSVTANELADKIRNYPHSISLKETWRLLKTESYKKNTGAWYISVANSFTKGLTIEKYKQIYYFRFKNNKKEIEKILFPLNPCVRLSPLHFSLYNKNKETNPASEHQDSHDETKSNILQNSTSDTEPEENPTHESDYFNNSDGFSHSSPEHQSSSSNREQQEEPISQFFDNPSLETNIPTYDSDYFYDESDPFTHSSPEHQRSSPELNQQQEEKSTSQLFASPLKTEPQSKSSIIVNPDLVLSNIESIGQHKLPGGSIVYV